MTIFLRLLAEKQKEVELWSLCQAFRRDGVDSRIYEVDSHSFISIPGSPFAYWVSEAVRSTYLRFDSLHHEEAGRTVCSTNPLGPVLS